MKLLTRPGKLLSRETYNNNHKPVFQVPNPLTKPRETLWLNARLEAQRFSIMMVGVVITALAYSLFQIPYDIAAGGIGGLGIIVNHFTGWPVGMIYLVMNIPLFVLGYFHLGRWPFVIRTALAVLIFSIATDLFIAYAPNFLSVYPLTNDMLLSAIYAGLVGGVGGGLVYRASSTIGGTGILGRIIQQKTGIPLSQVYLYTDGGIVLTAGLVFGWEIALYALLTLFLSGIASDYMLEGPSNVRTATIITNAPHPVAQALMNDLGHGVSQWQITGSYTGESRSMLMCTIYRPQVNDLKRIISELDPNAFVTIGGTHQALGGGFMPLKY